MATAARLGWAVDEALMCRNECTGGTSGLASTRGSGGTRAGRGGGAARGRSHLELQAQKLTLSNANELDWRATLARVAVRVKAGLSSELVARLAHLHTPTDEK